MAQVGFDRLLRTARRVSGHVGLELGQLRCHVRADKVRPQAEHLAELDPRRTKLAQRSSQSLTGTHRRQPGVGHASENPPGNAGLASLGCVIGEPSETVPGQHIPDLLEPLAVPKQHASHIIGHAFSAL
jgi:hypothetical protein